MKLKKSYKSKRMIHFVALKSAFKVTRKSRATRVEELIPLLLMLGEGLGMRVEQLLYFVSVKENIQNT
jgi:hypothetical protein